MPAAAAKTATGVALVCGEDEFTVKQRAREIFQKWTQELGGMDHEVIEAAVSNSGDALRVVGKLREALNTLPFFGGGKVVWLRDCNFLGEDRTAGSAAVTEAVAGLAEELKTFRWENVRLLISAGKVDKRKLFYKTLDKIGDVIGCDGWDEKNWEAQASLAAGAAIRERQKEIEHDALEELVQRIGPHPRQISSETEKLCLFVGERKQITAADVESICSRNKMSRAFALGDALGDRNLPRLLRCLDEELWAMQFDRDKSEIGLLYGLISKVRTLLMLKEMIREGWVKPTTSFDAFRSQLDRIPRENLPADKKYNPLASNPYPLFKALAQVRNYFETELVAAMDALLKCNQRLVTSQLDEALVLQQTLVKIVGAPGQQTSMARAA